ncbi:MFS transporter [Paenibacillus sp. J22TS3]|uniref:MFS transporter n=1 Tax=Paenibacillus sp. J22TS3 TaxID=2807192 RepID=UPI001B1C2650|nr:MFS transporter [Paenibacillus sp. J22TS3]GIP22035.1 putative MFS-type transporter YkuC [Paenibacillus sp. J22TS3]
MQLFKNMTFTKMFLANFTSQLGTVVGNMAFVFYLLDHFSSQPSYASIAELMYSLPTLAVFLFVGVLADKLDRKRIAMNSDWIRAGLTVILLLVLHQGWIAAAFAILFLRSAVSKFFAPAETSLLQGIMKEDQYVQAAGLNQSIMGIFMLFGTGLGSIAYNYLGIEGAIIIDGASFLISGMLIARCRFEPEVRLPNGPAKLKDLHIRVIAQEFWQGFKYIRANKLLLAIISGFLVFGVINGVFSVLPIFTMRYKLSPEHYQTYSALLTVFLGIGFLIGSSIAAVLIQKFSKVTVLISGLILSALLTFLLGMMDGIWIYMALVLITGLILAPVNVVFGGWLPELVDPSSMGRVSAWIDPLMMLGQSVSLGLVAVAFPQYVTIESLYMVLGFCILAVSLYYWVILPSLNRKYQLSRSESPGISAAAE